MVYGRTVLSQNYTEFGLEYQFFKSPVGNSAVSCKGYIALVRDGWVNECVTGGMTPTWDSQVPWEKPSTATWSNTDPMWTGLELNLGFSSEGLVTDHMSHGTALTYILNYEGILCFHAVNL